MSACEYTETVCGSGAGFPFRSARAGSNDPVTGSIVTRRAARAEAFPVAARVEGSAALAVNATQAAKAMTPGQRERSVFMREQSGTIERRLAGFLPG